MKQQRETIVLYFYIEIVTLILERFPHLLSIAGENGQTIAHAAAKRGSLEVIKHVIAINKRLACFSKTKV